MKKMRVNEAAQILGVSPSSVRVYANEGRLSFSLSPGGQRVFTQADIDAFLGKTEEETSRIAFYVRSSNGNKTLLGNQIEALTTAFGEPALVAKDASSGLNENRPGLWKIIRAAQEGKIDAVAVTQKDRLTRFGFRFLEELLFQHGVQILTAAETPEVSLQDELMPDFMNLLASFSGKFYRLRGYEQKKLLLQKAQERLNDSEG